MDLDNLRLAHLRSRADLEENSEISRPLWQRNLLAVPKEERSESQHIIVECVVAMDYAMSVLTGYMSNMPSDMSGMKQISGKLDIAEPQNREILKALCAIIYIEDLSGSKDWMNYIPEDILENFRHLAVILCSSHALEFHPASTDAEVVVPWFVAIIITSMVIPVAAPIEGCVDVPALIAKAAEAGLKFQSPSILKKCDEYLQDVVGSAPLEATSLLSILEIRKDSIKLKTLGTIKSPPFESIIYHVRVAATKVSAFIQALESIPTLEAMGEPPQPLYRMRLHLDVLHTDMTFLAAMFRAIVGKPVGDGQIIEESHFNLKLWWDTSKGYIKVLQRMIQQAKDSGADPYIIGVLYDRLFVSMAWGTARRVSYIELESVCDNVTAALDGCVDWAPDQWVKSKRDLIKTTKDKVLPYILQQAGLDKTAPVNPYATQSFINVYLKEDLEFKKERTCAHCQKQGTGFYRCSGCRLVFFCNAECQKKGWKSHKVACKKAQKK